MIEMIKEFVSHSIKMIYNFYWDLLNNQNKVWWEMFQPEMCKTI